ncbi:MAG: helix-turn-helix domain-containing protein [Clostridia bacterium]|nr:helix-turn-helix domain-containing protein [Clostridia bacterium]
MEARRLEGSKSIGGGRHIRVDRRIPLSFPLHSHDYFEIEIVLRGGGRQLLNSVEADLLPGSVTLLTPADFHRVDLAKGTEIWNISFDSSLPDAELLTRLTECRGFQRDVPPHMLARLDRAADFLLAECGEESPNFRPLISYLTDLILPAAKGGEQTPIGRALLYIDTYFRESPTLEQTAAQACLSPVYFGSLFKRVTGQTYLAYLNGRKLECARMLLENGVSVSQACFDSGFGSLSGFLYTFKRRVGVTPEEYRNRFSVRLS